MKIPEVIKNNLLLKITSVNSLVVGIRLLLAVGSQKIIAILVGQEGIALIGNIRNLIPMFESFSTVGIFNGIVKYIAEYKEDKGELQKLFSTSFVFLMVGVIASFCICFFGADILNDRFFGKEYDFSLIFKILAIAIPFLALNRFLNGIINGLSAYKQFAKINIVGYAISTVFLIYFTWKMDVDGALMAVALTPIILFLTLVYFFVTTLKEYINFIGISLQTPYAKQLLGFTVMSFVSTILLNYIEIDIRTSIKEAVSTEVAGNWTAMTNISRNYMLFASSIFTLYVLPKFATIKMSQDFRKELFYIYKVLLPIFGVGMLLVYFFRDFLIEKILYTSDFLEMRDLFKWQLLGDFVKIASIVLGYQFLAKKMVKHFVLTELLSLLLFFFFANYWVQQYGAEGVVFAHFARYVVYFFVLLVLLRKHIFGNRVIG